MRTKLFSVTLKDCETQTFRVGGAGGQRRDKKETGVRIVHRPSGAVGEARESRKQIENKRKAFRRMAESPTFQSWVRLMAAGLPSLDELVDEEMKEENLKVEYYTPK